MYVYCVYPAISKSPKQLPNWLQIAEASFVQIVFNCDINCMLKPLFTVALHESGTRNALLGPWLNNSEVYWAPFISTTNHTIAG
jgi:hypothetical protein